MSIFTNQKVEDSSSTDFFQKSSLILQDNAFAFDNFEKSGTSCEKNGAKVHYNLLKTAGGLSKDSKHLNDDMDRQLKDIVEISNTSELMSI